MLFLVKQLALFVVLLFQMQVGVFIVALPPVLQLLFLIMLEMQEIVTFSIIVVIGIVPLIIMFLVMRPLI